MILRLSTPLPSDWMCIVKTYEALPIRAVQRERIIKAMRLCRRRRYAPNNESDPVFARGIDDEHKAIEFQERVERWIARARHIRTVIII